MKINPYLFFKGNCEEAFKVYADVFGAFVVAYPPAACWLLLGLIAAAAGFAVTRANTRGEISALETDSRDRPRQDAVLERVELA